MAVCKPFFQLAVCPRAPSFVWHTYSLVEPPMCGYTVSLVSRSWLPYLSPSLNKGTFHGSLVPPRWKKATKPVYWKVMRVPIDQNKIAVGQRISNITIFRPWHVENEFISNALFRQHIKNILFLPTQNTLCLIHFYCAPAFLSQCAKQYVVPRRTQDRILLSYGLWRSPEVKLYSWSCCWLLIDFWQLAQERNKFIEMC